MVMATLQLCLNFSIVRERMDASCGMKRRGRDAIFQAAWQSTITMERGKASNFGEHAARLPMHWNYPFFVTG
jgi:hypothetical protein